MKQFIFATAAVAVLGINPTLVSAQSEGASDFLAEIRDQLARAERGDTGLAEQVSACLKPAIAAPDDVSVTAAVQIGADGKPSGLARMDAPGPDEAEIDHLRQFLALEAALIECSPFRLDNGSEVKSSRIVVSSTGPEVRLAETRLFDFGPAADATTEAALGLDRNDWREIQQRLELAGHELGRPDGVFGPRSRAALSDWQKENDLPVSGFLDDMQLDQLKAETETSYAAWQRSRRTVAQPPRQPQRSRGADGCLRNANGRIIPGQGFVCDAKGLVQF